MNKKQCFESYQGQKRREPWKGFVEKQYFKYVF